MGELAQSSGAPREALLAVWVVVNAVNLLQAGGFATRVVDPAINRRLGWLIIALAIPAGWALWRFIAEGSGWRFLIGPSLFLAFIALELAVDYVWVIEFRDPMLPAVLVPYLLLFFGSILGMGIQMYGIDMRLWAVTAVTSAILLAAMGMAMRQGTA